MLSALDAKGRLIHLLDETVPDRQPFTCPACGSAVRLRKGQVMRPHFAHASLQACQFFHENESTEHLLLKSELYRSLSKSAVVVVEKVLPELGQVADLVVNDGLALEVQCSRLSEERLRERTQAYRKTGFRVLWLLGKKLWLGKSITSLQKQFLYFSQNMGFHLWELDTRKRQLRLNYLIYEDWHGQLHYLTKYCSFDDDILDFLRQPFKAQEVSSYEVKIDQDLLIYIQKQLYCRNPKWLALQATAYQSGENLLIRSLEDYFPQVRPLESARGFCQIPQDLSSFCLAFFQYYQKQEDKRIQKLYPPAFYRYMLNRKEK